MNQLWYNVQCIGKIHHQQITTMNMSYTYWPADEGGFIGYWNDYPEYFTEGETLQELQSMLRDLRKGIDTMVAEDGIVSPMI